MSDCIKYPILFNDTNKKKLYDSSLKETNKLYDKTLNNSDSKDYSNTTDSKYEYDSDFNEDCNNYNKLPHILPAVQKRYLWAAQVQLGAPCNVQISQPERMRRRRRDRRPGRIRRIADGHELAAIR